MDVNYPFLSEVASKGYYLFMEHDKDSECITIKQDDKGRPQLDKRLSLNEVLLNNE